MLIQPCKLDGGQSKELDHHASEAYQQESANAEAEIVDAGSGAVLAKYVGNTIEIERTESCWEEHS